MTVRGVRGAVTISSDRPEEIYQATAELLKAVMAANPSLDSMDLASVLFTVTDDLQSAYPATAARESLGWADVPLLSGREIPVPGGLPRCIRVLIHWNTSLPQREIRHVYLGGASRLRPDLDFYTESEK